MPSDAVWAGSGQWDNRTSNGYTIRRPSSLSTLTSSFNVTVGGATWNIYRGSNGAYAVFSFVRTSNSNSGTLNVLAMLNWLRTSNWWGDVALGQFQFGYEISGTAGQSAFTTNRYTLSFG